MYQNTIFMKYKSYTNESKFIIKINIFTNQLHTNYNLVLYKNY